MNYRDSVKNPIDGASAEGAKKASPARKQMGLLEM